MEPQRGYVALLLPCSSYRQIDSFPVRDKVLPFEPLEYSINYTLSDTPDFSNLCPTSQIPSHITSAGRIRILQQFSSIML